MFVLYVHIWVYKDISGNKLYPMAILLCPVISEHVRANNQVKCQDSTVRGDSSRYCLSCELWRGFQIQEIYHNTFISYCIDKLRQCPKQA